MIQFETFIGTSKGLKEFEKFYCNTKQEATISIPPRSAKRIPVKLLINQIMKNSEV